MALSSTVRAKVIKLLQAGELSKRAISRETKVSRITIDKIEHTLLYPEKKKLPPPPKPKPRKDGKVVWVDCSKCRRKLIEHTPCLYCHIQQKQLSEYDFYMTSLVGK